MKRYLGYFGRALAAVSIAFLIIKITEHIHEIPDLQWGIGSITVLFFTLLFFVVMTYAQSYGWVVLLRGGGYALQLRDAYIIIGKSQIAKYLPGNIFHFVNRIVLGTERGISAEAITLSMGVETIVLAITAAIVSGIGLLTKSIQFAWLESFPNIDTIVLLSMTAGIGIIIVIVLQSPQAKKWLRQRLAYLHIGRLAIAVSIYGIVLMLNGVFIELLLKNLLGVQSDLSWYQFSYGFALAWVLGFVVPGAPGGIGIREAVFVGLFGKELGIGLAAGLAVVLRIITSISDLVTFGIASWLAQKSN